MTTPYRGYTELPGAAVPDVPYRVNLALREIDADVADAVAELETIDAAQAGRLAALESAAGFGAGMQLQDDAVNGLLLGNTKAAATLTKQIDTRGPAATVAALAVPASPTREAFDDFVLDHMADYFPGPMQVWGTALRAQKTKPALWVSLGSSTANGGNTANFGLSWAGRIACYLTGRGILNGAIPDLDPAPATRPTSGIHAYNGALGGTTSANYLTASKVAAIKKLQPTLITHMVGANDYGSSVAINTYKANLRNWKDQLDAASPNSVHLYIHQQGRTAAAPGSITWQQYGTAMREVADAYPNAVFLDAGERFGLRGGLAPHLVSDTLHMNEYGHRIMADLVAAAMGTPIPYMENEVRKLAVPGSQTFTAEGDWLTATIPAAPYPRTLTLDLAVFGYGTGTKETQGQEISIRATYPDNGAALGDAAQIRFLNGGTSHALTYVQQPTWSIDANREVTITIHSGPAIYLSGSGAYSRIHAKLSPA